MNDKPCLNCSKRKTNCHATCPDGLEQDKRNQERNELIRQQRDKDNAYMNYKIKEQTKVEKFKRSKKRK